MPRIAKSVASTRLNLELSVRTRKLVEKLRDKTNADSMAEVIRRAVTVYDYLVQHSNGQSVDVVASDENRITILL